MREFTAPTTMPSASEPAALRHSLTSSLHCTEWSEPKMERPCRHPRKAGESRAERPRNVEVMRVFIAGGSGLIGRHLAKSLLDDGHQPVILSRNADAVRRQPEMWAFQVIPGDPTTPGRWQEEVDGCDAVVNLAGHDIFADRWNAEVKRKIRDSRVHSAENLVAAIKQAHDAPGGRSSRARRSATTARTATKSSTSRARRAPISSRSFAGSVKMSRPTRDAGRAPGRRPDRHRAGPRGGGARRS